MAMELFVLSDRRLRSIAEWQHVIDAEEFPLRLSTQTPFEALDGILPVSLGDHSTDFECAHWDAPELMADYAELDFGHPWTEALAFRWGGSSFYSTPAAYMAGAAYAKATAGVVFDCEQGKILTSQHAVQAARDLLHE